MHHFPDEVIRRMLSGLGMAVLIRCSSALQMLRAAALKLISAAPVLTLTRQLLPLNASAVASLLVRAASVSSLEIDCRALSSLRAVFDVLGGCAGHPARAVKLRRLRLRKVRAVLSCAWLSLLLLALLRPLPLLCSYCCFPRSSWRACYLYRCVCS